MCMCCQLSREDESAESNAISPSTGYPINGEWHYPEMDVVSCFIDQTEINPTDISAMRAAQFNFTMYPTIEEALRCGGDTLAVDAVLLIAEHGTRPIDSPNARHFALCIGFDRIESFR